MAQKSRLFSGISSELSYFHPFIFSPNFLCVPTRSASSSSVVSFFLPRAATSPKPTCASSEWLPSKPPVWPTLSLPRSARSWLVDLPSACGASTRWWLTLLRWTSTTRDASTTPGPTGPSTRNSTFGATRTGRFLLSSCNRSMTGARFFAPRFRRSTATKTPGWPTSTKIARTTGRI